MACDPFRRHRTWPSARIVWPGVVADSATSCLQSDAGRVHLYFERERSAVHCLQRTKRLVLYRLRTPSRTSSTMRSSGYCSDAHEGLDLTVRGTGQMKNCLLEAPEQKRAHKKKKGRKLLDFEKTLDTHWRPAHPAILGGVDGPTHGVVDRTTHTLHGDLAIPLRRIGEILPRTNCILCIRNLAINDVKFLASKN